MGVVKAKNVSVAFGSIKVIENLNLDIEEGEFVVLLGSSGCGKSTLLNCIAGLQEVAEGEIWIGDDNVTWAEPKDRGVGMVFQSYALYPRMTVRENLSFGLRMAKMPKAEIETRVARAVSILQIGKLLDRRPAELSGGQRQRVASAAPWFATSMSSFSTNRFPISTPSSARSCGWRSRNCTSSSARP